MTIEGLEEEAKKIRRDIIEMVHDAKSGHPGGSLSCTDILVALFHEKMNLNLDENGNRIDKFILSKGHCAPAYYAVLASKGFIAHDDLKSLRKIDSYLEGHPSNKINGVDVSSDKRIRTTGFYSLITNFCVNEPYIIKGVAYYNKDTGKFEQKYDYHLLVNEFIKNIN